MKITKFENVVLDFVQKHMNVIFVLCMVLIALAVRYVFIPFESGDFIACLNGWLNLIRDYGGLGALKYSIGDYNVPYMFNVYDKFISIKQDNNGMFNIWNQNNGDYNMFFEEFKPFYIKYLINPDMQMDKIFNNIEFRNDVFDSKNNLIINTTLDYMKVKNEYQEGEHNFIVNSKLQSNIKQKFRIWRAFFPREKGNIKNRIRNPWVYVELGSRIPNINKNILHDMVVYYTI